MWVEFGGWIGTMLQIAEGWTVELDEEVHDIINKRTDRTANYLVRATFGGIGLLKMYTR